MIRRLLRQSREFGFFQAVRLLQRTAHCRNPRGRCVGHDGPPQREAVRFKTLPSLRFPGCEIADLRSVTTGSAAATEDDSEPLEMTVAFMGLTGPEGVLPDHYTTLLLERLREHDRGLLDFLDLFNHRAISHFYRAWEKYRLPFALERSRLEQSDDPGTQCVFSFIGYGTGSLRGRLAIEDQVLLYYAGHFSNQRRSAASLESLLRDYFQIPLRVRQFSGQWLRLDRETRSCLAGQNCPQGQNAQLGTSVIVGERVWDVQSKFRLYIGPLTYSRFSQFTPSGDELIRLVQLTRAFVGPEYDFDVQLALPGEQIPDVCLGATGANQPRLGWNTWLRSQPTDKIVIDAVFKTSNLGSAADPVTSIF